MSFSEAFRSRVFLAIGIAFVVGLLVFVCSDDEEVAAFNALVAFFFGLFYRCFNSLVCDFVYQMSKMQKIPLL